MNQIYNCLVLNDYLGGLHYATWFEEGKKTIETRWKEFRYRGDLVICCGKNSPTRNAGLAVCIVDYYDCVSMKKEHELMACIEALPGRKAMLTRNLRHFSRKFTFTKQYVSGAYQGIFQITLPEDVKIIL